MKVNDYATYHIAIERVSSSAAATRPPGGSPAGDNLLVALAIGRFEATRDYARQGASRIYVVSRRHYSFALLALSSVLKQRFNPEGILDAGKVLPPG